MCFAVLFLNAPAKLAENAKVLEGISLSTLLSIFLRILSALCGLKLKTLTARLPSAKVDEKK